MFDGGAVFDILILSLNTSYLSWHFVICLVCYVKITTDV